MGSLYSYREQGASLAHTRTEQPDPGRFSMHTHHQMEIYCFVSGRGIFHIEGSEYPLEPGDVLIMNPAESHYIDLDCTQPYERIVVNISEDFLLPVDPKGWLLLPFRQRPAGKHNLYKSSEFPGGSLGLFSSMTAQEGDRHVNLLSGLLPLLNRICLLWCDRREDPVPDTSSYRIVRYVNDHLAEDLSLDDICGAFFLSKSQLCRLFKKATGTTVWHYITVKRLAKARELLESGQSPTHVYTQCGFNDYSTFYRAYVKAYGTAPGAKE